MSILQAFVLWLFILLPIGLAMMNIKVPIYAESKTVRKIFYSLYSIIVIAGIILALPFLMTVFALSVFGNARESRHDD